MAKKISFENEYALHKLTEKHLKELFDLEFVVSEIQLNDLRLDNLAFDLKTNSFVIIEYKNEYNANVLNQAQEYYDLIQENRKYFTNQLDDTAEVNFENNKVMIIGPEFSQSQINEAKTNFELWKITLFDDGKVIYENLENNEVKSLNINLDDLKLTENTLLMQYPLKLKTNLSALSMLKIPLKYSIILKNWKIEKIKPETSQTLVPADH